MAKVEALKSKVIILKTKIAEASKDKEKADPAKVRALRRSMKRAQRKTRAMLRKKAPVPAKEKAKEGQPTEAPKV